MDMMAHLLCVIYDCGLLFQHAPEVTAIYEEAPVSLAKCAGDAGSIHSAHSGELASIITALDWFHTGAAIPALHASSPAVP